MNKQTFAGISAFAASIVLVHGAIVPPITGTYSGTTGGPPITIHHVPKFDGSLGTLTQVDFEISTSTSNTSLTFDNEGSGSGVLTFGLGSQFQAHATTADVFASSTLTRIGSIAADNDAAPDFTGTDSLKLDGGATASGSLTITNASGLSPFVAAGANNAFAVVISSLFTNPGMLINSPSGVHGVFNAPFQSFTGSFKIVYTYTPLAAIPEAGTVLFGAVMGLAVASRRIRRPRVA